MLPKWTKIAIGLGIGSIGIGGVGLFFMLKYILRFLVRNAPKSRLQSYSNDNKSTSLAKIYKWKRAVFQISVQKELFGTAIVLLDTKFRQIIIVTANHVFGSYNPKENLNLTLSQEQQEPIIINGEAEFIFKSEGAKPIENSVEYLFSIFEKNNNSSKRALDIILLRYDLKRIAGSKGKIKQIASNIPSLDDKMFRDSKLIAKNRIMTLQEVKEKSKFSTSNKEAIHVSQSGFIFHTAATEEGSSGCPIFDSEWKLCGFHLASVINYIINQL